MWFRIYVSSICEVDDDDVVVAVVIFGARFVFFFPYLLLDVKIGDEEEGEEEEIEMLGMFSNRRKSGQKSHYLPNRTTITAVIAQKLCISFSMS